MTNPTPTLRQNGKQMVTFKTTHHASAYDVAETLLSDIAYGEEPAKSAAAGWRVLRESTFLDGDPRMGMARADRINEARKFAHWDGVEDEWDAKVDTIVETLIKMGFPPEEAGAARSFYAGEG